MDRKLTYAIILNFNSSFETIKLYQSLLKYKRKDLCVIVLDNASKTVDRLKLINSIPQTQLILNEKNLGYAGGNNIGIDVALKAGAEYIWILNPDIKLEDDTLSVLLKTIHNNTKIAAVGPRIIKGENKNLIFTDGGILNLDNKCSTIHKHSNGRITEHPGKIDQEVDYIDGSCILLSSSALKDIGNFSEDYFLYFEETDWCTRAKLKGYSLAVNSHTIVNNLQSKKGGVYNYYMVRNRLIFAKRFHPNFKEVIKYYGQELLSEVLNKFKGKYFKPYFISKLKGYFAGIYKTL